VVKSLLSVLSDPLYDLCCVPTTTFLLVGVVPPPWPMAANRPVSDDELDQLPDRTSSHFDRVRDLVEQETDDSDA